MSEPPIADDDGQNPKLELRNPASSRVIVALATYNEIENLPSLVDEILRLLPTADILVIDDNSPDGTGRWCDERAAHEPRMACLHRANKQGLGSATLAGARWAIEHCYEVFITMDADWSHDPKHLPAVLDATRTADVAIGSRYCAGGAIQGWPLPRRVASRGMNWLTHRILRLPIHDTSGAFRAYRVDALRKMNLADVRAAGYAYLEEILWHLHQTGTTFIEVPITFRERRAGRSKISLREVAAKIATLRRLATSGHRD